MYFCFIFVNIFFFFLINYLWLSALLSAHLMCNNCNLSFTFTIVQFLSFMLLLCIHVAPLRPGSSPTSCTYVFESQPKYQKHLFCYWFFLFVSLCFYFKSNNSCYCFTLQSVVSNIHSMKSEQCVCFFFFF